MAVNIVDPDITPTVAVPFATPVGPNQQLWAVTTYQNRLYLGFVDTGPRPGLSAAAAGMKAYVVSTAVDSMVDAVVRGTRLTPVWQPELTVDLGYPKGSNMEGWPVRASGTLNPAVACGPAGNNGGSTQLGNQYPQLNRWNSWTDSWAWDGTGAPVNTDNPFSLPAQGVNPANGGTVGSRATAAGEPVGNRCTRSRCSPGSRSTSTGT